MVDLSSEESLFYFKRREAFGDIDDFVNIDFDINRDSLKYKIFLFYKRFLREHKGDSNRTLLEHINLKRLNFVYRHFIGENRDRYYIDALKSIEGRSDEVYSYLAKIYLKSGVSNKTV